MARYCRKKSFDQLPSKWDAGIEAYPYSYPILTKTAESYAVPNLGRVNFQDMSVLAEFGTIFPKQPNGLDYIYVKTEGECAPNAGKEDSPGIRTFTQDKKS